MNLKNDTYALVGRNSQEVCRHLPYLVHIASTISKLQHTKYLKPVFLDSIIGDNTGFPR